MSYKIALECLKKKMIYIGFKKLWIKISNTKGSVNYEDHFMRLNLWASDLLMVPSGLHGYTDCPFLLPFYSENPPLVSIVTPCFYFFPLIQLEFILVALELERKLLNQALAKRIKKAVTFSWLRVLINDNSWNSLIQTHPSYN